MPSIGMCHKRVFVSSARDLEQKSREGKASPYLPATIYAGLGEKGKALQLIEKAY
jgi:hypothetical protein